MNRLVIHVGPTLQAAEVRRTAPGAEIQPPVEGGLLGRTRPGAGDVIVVIDGYYRDRPAVRHKEIMYLIDQGVTVIGAASMGALRAAELDTHGMIGIGEVYRMYKAGEICGDDEVAIMHRTAEYGYRADSIALVNLRFGVQRALADGIVSETAAAAVVAAAKELPFDERTWPRVTAAARGRLFAAEMTEIPALARYCGQRACDLKARDALLAIEHGQRLAAAPPAGSGRPPGEQAPPWRTGYLRNWVNYWDSAQASDFGDWISDSDVLDAVRLYSPDYPELHHEVVSGLLAEMAGQGRPAPRYARELLGLSSDDPLPGRLSMLLSAQERQLPVAEQATLVVLRSWPPNLCRDWRPLAIATLKRQSSWTRWRDLVVAADAARNGRASQPRADVAALLFLHRWGASGPAVPRELGRRGFLTVTGLDRAASRFAALELSGIRRPG